MILNNDDDNDDDDGDDDDESKKENDDHNDEDHVRIQEMTDFHLVWNISQLRTLKQEISSTRDTLWQTFSFFSDQSPHFSVSSAL